MDKEYIERKNIVEYLRSRKGAYYDDMGKGWTAGMEAAASVCEKIPAADVVEVRHGAWVSLVDCANAGVYCSVCHKKVWKEDYAWCNRKNKLRSNYCPNCGARMDGE